MRALVDAHSVALGRELPETFGHLVVVVDIEAGTLAMTADVDRLTCVRLLLEAAQDLIGGADDGDE